MFLLHLTMLALCATHGISELMNCKEMPAVRTLELWDERSRAAEAISVTAMPPDAKPGDAPPTMAQLPSNADQCLDLQCLCRFLEGSVTAADGTCMLSNGEPLKKAVRKEYRMLNDDERARFHAAIKQVKASGRYMDLAVIHTDVVSRAIGAHAGPGFLPWHREYIKRVEFALRHVDPTVALPYWDSTLEKALPSEKDSMFFDDSFAGTSNGVVTTGAFAGFLLPNNSVIWRDVGYNTTMPFFIERDIQYTLNLTDFNKIIGFSKPRMGCSYILVLHACSVLEYLHAGVHNYVGGNMAELMSSSYDPLFFMHHAMVDHIWEQWRQLRQIKISPTTCDNGSFFKTRAERELQYPLDNQFCSSAYHFGARYMDPFFPFRTLDGLKNAYTDNLYEYAPRPSCDAETRDCNSKYLFCDVSHGTPHCAAKIRVGGNCTGFTNDEPTCYLGTCQGGKCIANGMKSSPIPKPLVTFTPVKQIRGCFNENPCCETWKAGGECSRNPAYMNVWCAASCNKCEAEYRLVDDCSDRHPHCQLFATEGECQKNVLWMNENCRKSCDRCAFTRAQTCFKREQVKAQTLNDDDFCYNQYPCCNMWGLQGECTRNATFMASNCPVTCGPCIPKNYTYGANVDYRPNCPEGNGNEATILEIEATARNCDRIPSMQENCRATCGATARDSTSASFEMMLKMCPIPGAAAGDDNPTDAPSSFADRNFTNRAFVILASLALSYAWT